jgi:N-acetylglucosaminyldiphosphoundecaprenol N-acetyl-beta-D-mannosaminyltransferase
MNTKLPSVKILGTSITTASKVEILEFIITRLKSSREKFYIVTPNPEILTHASTSNSFQKVLNNAAVSLPDGIGVLVAGNILKKEIKERIAGIDFMLDICKECARVGLSIGLLGGREGVAEKTAKCLVKMYPDLRVNLVAEEWDGEKAGPASDGVLSALPSRPTSSHSAAAARRDPSPLATPLSNHQTPTTNHQKNHIDILFVAFGFPRQEEWIANNLANIPVTAAMGVGGAFDYISGKVGRAPRAVRSVGMEWAFRLVRQPWRIKRQVALPIFVAKVISEKVKK